MQGQTAAQKRRQGVLLRTPCFTVLVEDVFSFPEEGTQMPLV